MNNHVDAVNCEELEKEYLSTKVVQSFKGIELKLATTNKGLEGNIKLPWRTIFFAAGVYWAVNNHGEAIRQALRFLQ